MKKVVYVTGCLGFIGSHVTETCLKKGWYVIGVDKCTYASNSAWIDSWGMRYPDQFMFLKTDINDLTRLYECDYVINTAAETHVDNSIEDSDDFVRSNIDGVHNLLKLINKVKRKKPILLHFSTDEVYGDIITGSHTEQDLLKPSNPYSATKAAADMLILAWGRTYNLPYIIVRPTNNYGIGQYGEKLIPRTVKFLSLGKPIELHDQGKPVRTWLHASDTSNAIIKIIESNVVNQIYNISGNYEAPNIVVVKKILNVLYGTDNTDGKITELSRVGQDMRYSIDDSKIKSLGWNAQADFDSELENIVNYYIENFVW
jgi:dTDP-glucose 4,6-dehydratase